MKKKLLLILCVCSVVLTKAQVLTAEDSLTAGLVRNNATTVMSGYGQAKVDYDLRQGTGVASLTRNVLFFGHKFNDRFGFFSEMEIENAKVEAGSQGEFSMEQLFIKTNLNRDMYLITGLFIPRIGIINENHLPNTFNGNDRHYIERLIIPTTWRELGISLYGQTRRIPGLNYSFAIMNGLNSAGFQYGSGIREGRQEGSFATASNIAITGALLYYYKNFRIQTSAYYGGSCGLSKREADSLQLNNGPFGTPVSLFEANLQYHNKGWQFKTLAAVVNIDDAHAINKAYGSNTSSQMMGYFAELGYNIFYAFDNKTQKNMTVFSRYEYADMNSKIPANGVEDNFQKKEFLVVGITYQPIRALAFKADYVQVNTGQYNKQLYVVNPYSSSLPFFQTNSHFNLGIAYSF